MLEFSVQQLAMIQCQIVGGNMTYIHKLEWKGFHTLKNTNMMVTYSINKYIYMYI